MNDFLYLCFADSLAYRLACTRIVSGAYWPFKVLAERSQTTVSRKKTLNVVDIKQLKRKSILFHYFQFVYKRIRNTELSFPYLVH